MNVSSITLKRGLGLVTLKRSYLRRPENRDFPPPLPRILSLRKLVCASALSLRTDFFTAAAMPVRFSLGRSSGGAGTGGALEVLRFLRGVWRSSSAELAESSSEEAHEDEGYCGS